MTVRMSTARVSVFRHCSPSNTALDGVIEPLANAEVNLLLTATGSRNTPSRSSRSGVTL
jgi:hypothetical protein